MPYDKVYANFCSLEDKLDIRIADKCKLDSQLCCFLQGALKELVGCWCEKFDEKELKLSDTL